MPIDTFPGYHACSQDGGYANVRAKIPFISTDSEEQWLTQGYYFWNHSSRYAKSWTPEEYRIGGSKHGQKIKRAIGHFNISLKRSLFWDLVGNPNHQEEFDSFADRISKKYDLGKKADKKVSVHQVIKEMRHLEGLHVGTFPYLAVKAVDNRKKGTNSYPFTESGEETLKLTTGTAQQVCVFYKTNENIELKSFIEPMEYKLNFIKEISSKENSNANSK